MAKGEHRIVRLDMRDGGRKVIASGLMYGEALAYIGSLRAERIANRDESTGQYPPIIHGISRS